MNWKWKYLKTTKMNKMKMVLDNKKPYVIEFTGTPRTGKTTLIKNIEDFFKKCNFSVTVLEEFTTSDRYKKEIKPRLKNEYENIVNMEIPKYVLEDLNTAINKKPDVILIDRSLLDRMIWVERLYNKEGISKENYDNYIKEYIPIIRNKINIIIGTYTDSLTALKRDYKANLSLEKRSFLSKKNVDEYNSALVNVNKISKNNNINFNMYDTTTKSEREVSFEIIDAILSDMRRVYIEELDKIFTF